MTNDIRAELTAHVQDKAFAVCESADGFSIHAPGSTDEEIAEGVSPPLYSLAWPNDDDHVVPKAAFDAARIALAAVA